MNKRPKIVSKEGPEKIEDEMVRSSYTTLNIWQIDIILGIFYIETYTVEKWLPSHPIWRWRSERQCLIVRLKLSVDSLEKFWLWTCFLILSLSPLSSWFSQPGVPILVSSVRILDHAESAITPTAWFESTIWICAVVVSVNMPTILDSESSDKWYI
mgnify:CR=1 FL=1